jgi:hypothetical protein
MARPLRRWAFHLTPTSGSWLNAVETFFSAFTRPAAQAQGLPLDPSSCREINRHLAGHNEIIHRQDLTKRPRIDALLRAEVEGIRRIAAAYPPAEFRGHTQAAARPVPVGRARRQMTPPGLGSGARASAPAPLAGGLGVMTGLASRRPVGFVPEKLLVATVRHDMVHHGRRHHAPQGLAGGTQRVARQEDSSGPAPARTVAAACRARPLPVQRPLHRRRALRPQRSVQGRLDRHGESPRQARPAARGV